MKVFEFMASAIALYVLDVHNRLGLGLLSKHCRSLNV